MPRKSRAVKTAEEEKILDTAEQLFKKQGYHAVHMADIARASALALPAMQSHYHDKEDLLSALLDRHSPREAIQQAMNQLRSDTPENLVRHAIRHLIEVFNNHTTFVDLAVLDWQVSDGSYMTNLFTEMAGDAASFINRLANMPGMRPISSVMLARAFASILIGFVATQQMAPRSAQFAMRLFPEKAWVDGIADIFLYGILENED